ncbi:cache domain-containing protein [Legionella quinlivanii]|uniref:cache domain-containing protein n=1 Tax=Legionella quinlivanii TaxID=45073 RepID=UPI003908AF5C
MLNGDECFCYRNRHKHQEKNVIKNVKKAKAFIRRNGKSKAMAEFKKNSSKIFAIELNGTVLASPIHPETVGTNQINYIDPYGVFVVREEIAKAKSGGGWLKGRYRKNHITGHYACRKVYILLRQPFFIGSWYYYPANEKNECVI